jgi:hypothetical protein
MSRSGWVFTLQPDGKAQVPSGMRRSQDAWERVLHLVMTSAAAKEEKAAILSAAVDFAHWSAVELAEGDDAN